MAITELAAAARPDQALAGAPFLHVTWADDESPARGYVVVDRLVTGIATGGLRMRAGCTLDEVADLAREMTLKMGAYGIHVGGAKGGIDFDPADPRAGEVRARFLRAVRPLLESYWVTAGDLGTPQAALDETCRTIGLGSTSFHAAMVRAADESALRARVGQVLATAVDGVSFSDGIGGFGVAEAALAGLRQHGIPAERATAVVQGFGAMGGGTAHYLARAGVRVVGVADAQGLILNQHRGLDVDRLLAARTLAGVVDRTALRADDVQAPGDAWLDQPVDVLVPAAVSYAITRTNCERIRARLVVEAANVPTTADAEARLRERGVTVVPDFVANTGAAAGVWWTILGEVSDYAEACGRLSGQVQGLVTTLMRQAAVEGVTAREVARRVAAAGTRSLQEEYGVVVPRRPLFPARSPGAGVASVPAQPGSPDVPGDG